MATHSRILAWRGPGQGSLVGYRPQGRRESDTTERFNIPTSGAQICHISPNITGFQAQDKHLSKKKKDTKNYEMRPLVGNTLISEYAILPKCTFQS